MLPYIVSIIGLVFGGARVGQVSRASVDAEQLSRLLAKLISVGHFRRAKMLLEVVPHSVYAGMLLDVLVSFEEVRRRGDTGPGAEALLMAAFECSREERMSALGRGAGYIWIAALCGLAGLALAYIGSAGIAAYVLAAAAFSLAAYGDQVHDRIARTTRFAHSMIIPALMEHLTGEPASANRAPSSRARRARRKSKAKAEVKAPAPDPDEPWLEFAIREPGQPERRLHIARRIIKIGKLSSSHIRIGHDDDVSRMHAVIELSDEGVMIIDLGSTRGTYVNGERVDKKRLCLGDVVRLAGSEVQWLGAGPKVTV
jgi:23S rRNA maturation mini-RNase III